MMLRMDCNKLVPYAISRATMSTCRYQLTACRLDYYTYVLLYYALLHQCLYAATIVCSICYEMSEQMPKIFYTINVYYIKCNGSTLMRPEPYHFIFTPTGNLLPINTPVDSIHFIRVSWQVHLELSRSYIPYLKSSIFGTTN